MNKKYKEYIKKIKSPYWRARSNYIKYYDKLPLQEKDILLEAQHGREFNGNIFYIAKYLSESKLYSEYNIFLSAWGKFNAHKYQEMLDSRGYTSITVIVLGSDKYYQVMASAKYLINDNTFLPFFIKKDGQVYLNTWHGTPLKTLGKRMLNGSATIGNVQKNFVTSDYILFPNEYTKEHMVDDYMLTNISPSTKTICCSYPRNEIFHDKEQRQNLREEMELTDKRIYVYMPTYRGKASNSKLSKYDAYLLYYLYELDKLLNDDEIIFIKLHLVTIANVNLSDFAHIRRFPKNLETYEVLNIADVLITDYSSVLFDFAETGRKIVLFPYDKEEYFENRGTYLTLEKLPFPQVFCAKELIDELRSGKNYNDSNFLQIFSPYDSTGTTKALCDFVILQKQNGLIAEPIPDNKKENIMIYAGNLAKNGITTSLKALLNSIDLEQKNYILTFCQNRTWRNEKQLQNFSSYVNYFAITGWFNLRPLQKMIRMLFERKKMSAKVFSKLLQKRLEQNILRSYGGARIDAFIQFNGYDDDIIMMYGAFNGKKYIYAHSDMLREVETRKNARKDVLQYAYSVYDRVLPVSSGIVPAMSKLLRNCKKISVCKNVIDYKNILEQAELPIMLDNNSKCSLPFSELLEKLTMPCPKFINIARFSPEKGHERLIKAFSEIRNENPDALLFIMGGNSYGNNYKLLLEKVESLGLMDNVILLLNIANPYPILKACDYFVLSSFYEGFGLVLAEADILGKAVISTDIDGPREFMQEHGGTIVENSQEGIFHGMKMLLNGEVPLMNVDYEAYNKECVNGFEKAIE